MSGSGRILPFLGASVAAHIIAIGAFGTDPLAISLSPRGVAHEVSVRLEAAAPTTSSHARKDSGEPGHSEASAATPTPEPDPSPAATQPTQATRTASRQARPTPDESDPTEPKAADPAETTPEPHQITERSDRQARRAERVAKVEDSATGSASVTSPATMSEAREALVAELAKYFHYPRLARRRGWEGTVVLSVRILPDGRLEDIRVVRSSGRALLDRSAVASIDHVRRLPQFADRIGRDGLALQIPVTYRLESA